MKNTDYPTITAMITHKTELEKQLDNKQLRLSTLTNKADQLERQRQELENHISGLRSSIANRAMHRQPELNAKLEQRQRLQPDLDKNQQERTETKRQIDELKAQVSACNEKVGVHSLLAHQQAIVEAQDELDKFQQLITGQQQTIKAAGVHEDGLPPLIQRRGELLADMALGEDKAAELAELDIRIAALREEQDNAQALGKQAITQAQHTIAGLEPRMTAIQDRLKQLDGLTPKMLDLFFMDKAQQAAHEFTALADKLVQRTMELRALKEILQDIGQRGKVDFFAYQCSMLTIPCIEGVVPLENLRGAKGTYANTHWEHVPYAETVSQIKQGLAEQGVNV